MAIWREQIGRVAMKIDIEPCKNVLSSTMSPLRGVRTQKQIARVSE
ncbi:MAG TPA: hypothetical protein VE986_02210 [Hyphomicrobiales bacterium]|nr:hypothetical protein [Hyphomicrobiales bacterium]